MPLVIDTAFSNSTSKLPDANRLTIGLVNNMPDAALETTERQFLDLIRAATPDVVANFKLYWIPEVQRAENVWKDHARRYRDISELWDTHLDGLIVTGAEPRAAKLGDEPYWATLARLVDWAREQTTSTIWSCLAAHAAVLHSHGIEREPFGEKLFGVYDCEVINPDPLLERVVRPLQVPHSRYNGLSEAALADAGYRLLVRSAGAGVGTTGSSRPAREVPRGPR